MEYGWFLSSNTISAKLLIPYLKWKFASLIKIYNVQEPKIKYLECLSTVNKVGIKWMVLAYLMPVWFPITVHPTPVQPTGVNSDGCSDGQN